MTCSAFIGISRVLYIWLAHDRVIRHRRRHLERSSTKCENGSVLGLCDHGKSLRLTQLWNPTFAHTERAKMRTRPGVLLPQVPE